MIYSISPVFKLGEEVLTKYSLSSACFAIALTMVSFTVAMPTDVAAGSIHDPILIKGNQSFTAANGVVGGSGTSEDPYVVEGWQIYPTATTGPAIHIIGTTAHFVIRDVLIQGSSMWPDGPIGVYLEHSDNFEIDSVYVSNCSIGIVAYKARDSVVEGCLVHDNGMGIRLTYSRNVTVVGNTVYSGIFDGICVATSEDCVVTGNQMTNTRGGLLVQYSLHISVIGNTLVRDAIRISGGSLPQVVSHTISADNTVNGLPVYYYAGAQGLRLEGIQAGEIILAGCFDIRLADLRLTGSSVGAEIVKSRFVSLDSCVFESNLNGMWIIDSAHINIRNCQFIGNENGMRLFSSTVVTISQSQFTGSIGYGISMFMSDVVVIRDSTFSSDFVALNILECSRVLLSGNVFTANSRGASVDSCSWIHICENEFSYTTYYGWGYGLSIWDCRMVLVTRNNFVENDVNAWANDAGDVSWDDGASIGNYWDDYNGSDGNGDLIGDTPYIIDADDQDDFPHIVPFPI